MKKTTWQGLVFILAWVLIAVAAVLYAVSEYTVDPHKGQVQENLAIGFFAGGLISLLASRLG